RTGSPRFTARLGGKTVAIEREDGRSAAVRVDTDGDGDLGDEKPVAGAPIRSRYGRGSAFRFGPITCSAERAGTEPVQFFLEAHSASMMLLYPARCRAGDVRFGGETCRVALVDSNYDGRYDNVCRLPVRRS